MKQGAIFDMDGTLVDTERLYRQAWFVAADKWGVTATEDFRQAMAGLPQAPAVQVIHRFHPTVDDPTAFYEFGMNWVWTQVKQHLPLRPGAREILAYFRDRGMRIALASSSWRAMILDNLTNGGLLPYFDAIISGEDVKRGKPAPDIFLLAAERLGLAPEDCYVLEDSVSGARAGVAAGCTTIMVEDLFPATDDLKADCAAILPSLPDVMAAVDAGRL